MARLMFSNEDEQNNNEQTTSIIISDNKSKNVIIMTKNDNSSSKTQMLKKNSINGCKSRQLSPCHISNNTLYAATNVLVSDSTVARLASKFSAAVTTDENPVNKIHSQVSLMKKYPEKKSITVRNSSVLETIKFFENDNKKKTSDVVDGKESMNNKEHIDATVTVPDDLIRSQNISKIELKNNEYCDNLLTARKRLKPVCKNRLEKCIAKPVVQPKPVILLQKVTAGKENRSSKLYKTDQFQISENTNENVVKKNNSENSHYHAPKLLTKNDKNVSADYQIVILKNKRLSIAKDFSLESVLNNGLQNEINNEKTETNIDEKNENLLISSDKMANDSFLHHKYVECLINETDVKNKTGNLIETRKVEDDFHLSSVLKKNFKNSSSLHDSLINSLNESENSIYEDLTCIKDVDDSEKGYYDHQYSDIKELNGENYDSSNVYDDVIYAQLYNNDDVENYETISSKPYETTSNILKNDNLISSEVIIKRSDSDSSFEQVNSLYGLKPSSDFSSATASSFSSSYDCINIKMGSPYVFVHESKTSNSDVSDHEVYADDWDSDDNSHDEIIVYRKRSRSKGLPIKKRKFKFLLHKVSVSSGSIIYLENKSQNSPINGTLNTTKKLDKPRRDFVTIVRSVLYPLPNYEAQEITTLFSDYPEDFVETPVENDTNIIVDDFDDSASDLDSSEINGHIDAVNQLNKRHSTNPTYSQNIYGLMERATRKVRKSLSSFSQIRKINVGNISNNFPLKTQEISPNSGKAVSAEELHIKTDHSVTSGGSIRWTPFKRNFQQRYSTSVFYVKPEDLCFDIRNTNKQNNANSRRRRMTCIELHPTRPTSPPPPPPVDKSNLTESLNTSSSNAYSDRSNSSYESRNSVNDGDLDSSRSSDLNLRFADEPLYQFYAESIVKMTTSASMDYSTDSDGYEEIASNTSRPSAMELILPSPNGHGQYRTLWCEVEEVKNSGILGTLSPSKQRLQEAIFEIITSEASYYKSLSVLDKIFANNPLLKDEVILSKSNWKILFGNVAAVRKCSERLLAALEQCWQECILLTGLCDIIYQHASENFKIYVKYCSNQIYIDRTLKNLKEQNTRYVEIISQLEANPMCQSLSLHSFLMLPMQRITRMPLLIDAVLSKMDPLTESVEYKTYQITLATLNKIVKECNETARKLERYEEMLLLGHQLEFSRKDVKMFPVASTSRWLIRSGPMVHINPPDIKLTFTRKLTKQTTKFYFFLFNDIFVVSKKKSDDMYVVFDYCARNMLQMSLLEDNYTDMYKYLLLLIILENHEGKTIEMILNCDSDSTRQRWLEATSSHVTSDNPEEKLYEEWDCPQVSAIHAYTAVQPDELSLQAGDVVKVLKKTTDGWYHGERIRDGMTGWFPGNYTVEIASQHMRAKNLRLRHRLLTLSGTYLQYQQQKKL